MGSWSWMNKPPKKSWGVSRYELDRIQLASAGPSQGKSSAENPGPVARNRSSAVGKYQESSGQKNGPDIATGFGRLKNRSSPERGRDCESLAKSDGPHHRGPCKPGWDCQGNLVCKRR